MGQTCDTAKGTYGAGGKGPERGRERGTAPSCAGGAQRGASGVPAAGGGRDPHCRDGGRPRGRAWPLPHGCCCWGAPEHPRPLQAPELPEGFRELPLGHPGRSGSWGGFAGTRGGEREFYASPRSLLQPQTPPGSSREGAAPCPCSRGPGPGRVPAWSCLAGEASPKRGSRQSPWRGQSLGLPGVTARTPRPIPGTAGPRPSPPGEAAPLHQLHQPLPGCPRRQLEPI